ncbi:MAG: choice-of-anchor V domain-containing protein [Pseudomonadota bacterium]
MKPTFAAAAILCWAGAAHANPTNAPWTAVLPDAPDSCASCHWETDPVTRSPAVIVEGLPERADPGALYEIIIRLQAEEAVTAAFLAVFSAGEIIAAGEGLETTAAAVRTPDPSAPAAWRFTWRAPAEVGPVRLDIAAVAANDDASPFGDIAHYATRTIDRAE